MTISEELRELYVSSGDDVILHTLSFNHTSWDTEFFIVRDFQDFTANLENDGPETTFLKFAFNIKGPDTDINGNQVMNISVDAVNRQLVSLLETAANDENNNPIEVTYRQYIASDTTGPQNDPPLKLYMNKVQINNQKIQGTAELINLQNRKFPNVVYGNTFQSLVLMG